MRQRLWIAATVGCWAASTLASAQAVDPRYAAERAAKQAAKQAAAAPPASDRRLLPLNEKVVAKTDLNDRRVSLIWRVACYRLDAAPGDLVRVGTNVFGERAILGATTDNCEVDPQLSVTTALDNAEDGGNRSLLIRQGQWPTYVKLWMRGTDRTYEITALKLTPAEFAILEADRRRAEEDARKRRAERRAAFGQMLATGIAVGGVAAVGGDVSTVPLNGNALEILNGANAEIARQNETNQARFDATMEQARREAIEQQVRRSGSSSGSSSGAITVAQAPRPAPAPAVQAPKPAPPRVEPVRYFSCIGSTRKRMPNGGDGVDTMFYGIVTGRGDPQDATNVFRQHTGSYRSSDAESPGASCFPHDTRSDAEAAVNAKIQRDGSRFPQVTGIELTM